ncbi:MAG: TetR/AcrR family transcriptional regulator, regulator of cefoperazone and chloramphenicol [Desulfovibrionales bacterium]|nr:TetR/AcrR family transcriptional regulator, regulator of cefoperazone and chloramphenicol [Desulfovibrionales bacterium]
MLFEIFKQALDRIFGMCEISCMKEKTRPQTRSNTRLALIRVATKLFAQSGFKSTSIREICAAAKVNNAAISYHFGSKMGLYKAVVAVGIDRAKELYPDPVREEGESPEDLLRRQVETLLLRMKVSASHKWYLELLQHEILVPATELKRMVDEHYISPIISMLTETFRLIKEDADDALIILCITYLFDIMFFHGLSMARWCGADSFLLNKFSKIGIEESARQIVAFVIAGFKNSAIDQLMISK